MLSLLPSRTPTPTSRLTSLLAVLLLASSLPLAQAGNGPLGTNCSALNNRLDSSTHAFVDDCDARGYCGGTNTCLPKQCRTDEFPFGFAAGDLLPPLCPPGQFCPDEESGCLPLRSMGESCQLNRDDQCLPPSFSLSSPPPSNYRSSSNPQSESPQQLGRRNSSSSSSMVVQALPPQITSICLHLICTPANATLSSPCFTDETVYVGYSPSNVAFTNVVSRDNCVGPGLFCDRTSSVCLPAKGVGERCGSDKECLSYNCNPSLICQAAPEAPVQIGGWGYALVGVGIVLMIGLLVACLWTVHKKGSAKKRAELDEYYKEQLAYRTSILSLQSAVQSLPLAAPPPPPPPSRKNTSHSNSNTHSLPPHRSRSHHSLKNPFDDSDYDDRLSLEEDYEEKKFGYGRDELEGFYGGLPLAVAASYEQEPQSLPYGYSSSEGRGSGGRRGGTYEDWDEVDLKERSRTR